MSAVVGLYYRDNQSVDRADLKRMTHILTHRGPDGQEIWCKGPVGFGHCMLFTTPESLKERLPLTNRTGNLTIMAEAASTTEPN